MGRPPTDRGLARVARWVCVVALLAGCERGAQRVFATAETRFAAGDYLGAVRQYERVTEEFPRSTQAGDAYYWVGMIEHLYLNDQRKAIEAFRNLVARFPQTTNAPEAQRLIGEIYEKKFGDLRLAIAEYQRLLREFPDVHDADQVQYHIGEAYFDLGDLDQARLEWDTLLKQRPQNEWAGHALYRIGGTFFLQGHYQEAFDQFDRLLRDYPEGDLRIEARFWQANCLEELERLTEALTAYREIQEGYSNPGVIKVKIQRLEARLDLAEKSLREPAPHASAHRQAVD